MVPKSGMNKNQMNGLYPIIRRVRRPLLPVEAPADAKPSVVPAAPPGRARSAPIGTGPQKPKEKYGEATATKPNE